ncbi:MAG: hypothetical protein II336_15675 [Loktanella sp.]|nr:hypothetical protein [Loktanella sp.]
MDEVKTDKNPTSTHTTINHTEAKPTGAGSMIWFLVGGLVVAIVVVGYFVMGDGMPSSASPTPAGGDVSVNIETSPTPAAEAPATETAPNDTPAEE